jgi:hypothetical protein
MREREETMRPKVSPSFHVDCDSVTILKIVGLSMTSHQESQAPFLLYFREDESVPEGCALWSWRQVAALSRAWIAEAHGDNRN